MSVMDNSFGLVMGIANYQHINPLPSIVLKDAKDIYQLLTDPNHCGYLPLNVELLLDTKATMAAIKQAFKNLAARCNQESTVFFYISSHGGRIEAGPQAGEYLLPVDACHISDKALADTAISGEQFTTMLQSIRARKVVVVFDCCFSGGIGQPNAKASKLSTIPESYYEELARGRGRVILASSRSTEFSYVLPGATNSLFTQHMLAALYGGVPGPGGVIRIFDLYNYIQPKVTLDHAQQHPIFRCEVEENFPIALHLGGKMVDATSYQSGTSLDGNSQDKPGRIMRQLDLLLGVNQKLSDHERDLLFAALLHVVGKNPDQKDANDFSKSEELADEVKYVVDEYHGDLQSVVHPYPHTEFVSALLKIGLRLDLRRKAMTKDKLSHEGPRTVDDWLAYLTDEIVCERGILRFHLIAPNETWIKPLIGATAMAMESLWQQVRSVLTRNGLSFAVGRSKFEIDERLQPISPEVLKEISEVAQKATSAWPSFPHFGSEYLPALDDLIPLPKSSIRAPIVFRGKPGCEIRLLANGLVVAQDEEKGEIEYWPADEGPLDCILECNEGAGFVPIINSRVQRLYTIEEEIFKATEDPIDACHRLGLKNELLKILWPKITAQNATLFEFAEVLHILRDAWNAYDSLSPGLASLFERRDIYWDAMELVRKRLTSEGKNGIKI